MRTLIALLLLALAGTAPAQTAEARPSKGRPNVVFILADDLGYGDLGCYGQETIRTPNIDRMARQGIRFTQFYAGGPVCSSSRASLLGGLHNGHTTIKTIGRPMAEDDVTLAEALKMAGYRTGVIGKWGMGNVGTSGEPNAQGFDFAYGYYDHIRAHNSYPDHLVRNRTREPLDNEVIYITNTNHYAVGIGNAATKKKTYSNELFTREALSFIERNANEGPFFLYQCYTIPHANNEAWLTGECGMEVPDYGIYADEDWPEARKAGASMIEYLDGYVGQILDKLEEEGVADRTVVMFSSDNGPHGEGGWRPDFFDSNGIYRGMKRDLYEGGIRVPFIARWPGVIEPGENHDARAFWDVMPTLCEIASLPSPATDGLSFAPSLRGEAQEAQHEFLYWEFRTSVLKQAARKGPWKAIRVKQGDKTSPTELYDLEADVIEQNDVAAQHPEKVRDLEQVMDRFEESG